MIHFCLLQLKGTLVQAPLLIPVAVGMLSAAAAEDAELGVAAQLPDVQAGRGGDGAATEVAQRGVAAHPTEMGVDRSVV